MEDSILKSHDRLGSEPECNHGLNWRRKRRQAPRRAWHKDPEQGTSRGSSYKDRMRNIKFTEEENDLLVSKVLENYSKLYGDDASRTSNFEKKKIWRGILESINGLGVCVRNMDTCKKRFADCKRFVRTKMTKHWRRSGGRQAVSVYFADWEEKIKSILCPVTDGIPGLIDSADPCTYECPGRWSPNEPASPEAQLSPDEDVTPEFQYFPEALPSADNKLEGAQEWGDVKEPLAVKVKEEFSEATAEFRNEEDVHRNRETLGQIQISEEQTQNGEGPSEMYHLLHQNQEAFHRSLRQQLHAVRQELRDFRRDHVEKMDQLLNIHKEHIAVEQQRNEILSQLVGTVNLLASRLSTSDLTKDRQSTQGALGSNDAARPDSTDLQPQNHVTSQVNQDAHKKRRKRRELHDGTESLKRE